TSQNNQRSKIIFSLQQELKTGQRAIHKQDIVGCNITTNRNNVASKFKWLIVHTQLC
ncbi:hypothetical protein MTR67_018092, partial [Solanum verrucosum]